MPRLRFHLGVPLINDLTRGVRARVRGHDLVLASAGATLFGAIAAIPTLLVAIGVAGLIFGRERVQRLGADFAQSIPNAMGAAEWVTAIVRAGLSLSIPGILIAAVLGSAYGRGLSRALVRFAPDREELPPSWWSRILSLPGLGLAPLLMLALLVAAPKISHLSAGESAWGVAGASYLALNLVWVITWLPLTWAFRVVTPGRPRWRAALISAVVTGAFISGFLQGFVLFLALPVDLGRPFGGLEPIGVASALLLWLWVLHAVICLGYALTWAVDGVLAGREAARDD